jgi:hypothetical protein
MLKQVVHILTTVHENVNETIHSMKSVRFWCENSHTACNWTIISDKIIKNEKRVTFSLYGKHGKCRQSTLESQVQRNVQYEQKQGVRNWAG